MDWSGIFHRLSDATNYMLCVAHRSVKYSIVAFLRLTKFRLTTINACVTEGSVQFNKSIISMRY